MFATPDPNVLCVVERGTAFLLDVRDPAEHQVVPAGGSVSAVISARSCDLLLLATPWAIIGVGEQGVSWTTGRISVEDLRVDEIDDGWLRGVADPDDEPRDFAVELSPGRVVGGAGL